MAWLEELVTHPDFLCLGPFLCIIPGTLLSGILLTIAEQVRRHDRKGERNGK